MGDCDDLAVCSKLVLNWKTQIFVLFNIHFAILLNKYCSNMALRHILNELEKLESNATLATAI